MICQSVVLHLASSLCIELSYKVITSERVLYLQQRCTYKTVQFNLQNRKIITYLMLCPCTTMLYPCTIQLYPSTIMLYPCTIVLHLCTTLVIPLYYLDEPILYTTIYIPQS